MAPLEIIVDRSTSIARDGLALLPQVAVAIWIAGLLIAATVLFPNLTPAKLFAGLGLGSIAIGLAFKDIFENFLDGILILLREPMRLQDYIEGEGVDGQVEKITVSDTYIRRTDGQLVPVPNAVLLKNPVFILTDRPLRRTALTCGVAYSEYVDEARRVIEATIKSLACVDQSRPIQVFAQAFGSSSIDFEVTWWTGSRPAEARRSRDAVVAAVKVALDEAGIEIPFPSRTLTFKEPFSFLAQKDRGKPRRAGYRRLTFSIRKNRRRCGRNSAVRTQQINPQPRWCR